MKTAGIIGGTSWYLTEDLYRYVNKYVEKTLGGNNCAKMVLVNVNLQEILDEPDRRKKGEILVRAAQAAERAGVDFVVICSNGLHEFADQVQDGISVPLVHIAENTVKVLRESGVKTVGLLGAKDTMEKDFYIGKLEENGLRVLVPELADRDFMDDVVFNEVGRGEIKESSCRRFYEISEALAARGAEGVILGCTEIGELMQQEHTAIRLFDTTQIHAEAIARMCIED